MNSGHLKVSSFVEDLDSHLGSVLNGSLPLSAFIRWFNNSEWEARMAADSSALRVCWDIQNILYQIEDHPDHIDRGLLHQELARMRKELRGTAHVSTSPGRVV
jgi:hypothetical protein